MHSYRLMPITHLDRRYRRAGLVPPSIEDVVRAALRRFLEEQQPLPEKREQKQEVAG